MIQMRTTLLRRELPNGWEMHPLMANMNRYYSRLENIIVDETIAPHPFEQENMYILLSIRLAKLKLRPHWEHIPIVRDIFIGSGMDTRATRIEVTFDQKRDSQSWDIWYTFPAAVVEEYLKSSKEVLA